MAAGSAPMALATQWPAVVQRPLSRSSGRSRYDRRSIPMGSGLRADGSSQYVLVTGEAGAARLQLLHHVYGKSTEALLTELGIAPGMRAVDIGCGIGTVSRWIAGRVGSDGAVIGVDVASRRSSRWRGAKRNAWVWRNCASIMPMRTIPA